MNEIFGQSLPSKVVAQPAEILQVPTVEIKVVGKEGKEADPTATARTYRRETADLLKKLDGLLNVGSPSSPSSGSAKSRRRCKGTVQFKPRARNIVLKQAVEMVWKLQCDELVGHHDTYWLYLEKESNNVSWLQAFSILEGRPATINSIP